MDMEQSPLWNVFKSEAQEDYQKLNLVKNTVKKLSQRLDLVRDTFPTYTLHNHVHSDNVIRLIGDLLGDDIGKLSCLEAAILILSAYLHDIGMVYTEEERLKLSEDDSFRTFLDKNPSAYIQMFNETEISPGIAEWYCRWNHADRVFTYLNTLEYKELFWGVFDLKEVLGNICASHNSDIDILKNDTKYSTKYRYEADLKFCSILLRLADILDFDNTRTPEEVYSYLGIERRETKPKEMSDIEWRKHLCSEGFVFQKEDKSCLGFKAYPNEPCVEYDVRKFLDEIELELIRCNDMLRLCSDRWRGFSFPTKIDRSNIISNGYKYGEYAFSISKDEALNLFMGNNLYENQYVFIRELLQNSIDTTRYRVLYEHANGNILYTPKPIEISCWMDNENYYWIKIDDYGMGMDEYIIKNYFLKVGQSYYESLKFKADALKYYNKLNKEFKPISRFGIGIVSCFQVCDKIELSTVKADAGQKSELIRLSMSGLHGFYTMQTGNTAKAMPCKTRTAKNRNESGTSIALRLDPKKESGEFDLKSLINNYVFCSDIPITLEGKDIGKKSELFVDKPWTNYKSIEFSDSQIKKVAAGLNYNFPADTKITLEIIPLDLTKYSDTPYMKGQALLCLVCSDELEKSIDEVEPYESRGYSLDIKENKISLNLYHSYDEDLLNETVIKLENDLEAKMQDDATHKDDIKTLKDRIINLLTAKDENSREKITFDTNDDKLDSILVTMAKERINRISHNGIIISNTDYYTFEEFEVHNNNYDESKIGWIIGSMALYDSLRPNLKISRNGESDFPWAISSCINLALQKALKPHRNITNKFDFGRFFQNVNRNEVSLEQLLADPRFRNKEDWPAQPIINTSHGKLSLKEIKDKFVAKNNIELLNIESRNNIGDFYYYCATTLIQTDLDICLVVDNDKDKVIIKSIGTPVINKGQLHYPPLYFINYQNSKLLKKGHHGLNLNHPFSVWLVNNSPFIYKEYRGIFNLIKGKLLPIYYWDEIESTVSAINSALDRLSRIDSSLGISREIYLGEKDFAE